MQLSCSYFTNAVAFIYLFIYLSTYIRPRAYSRGAIHKRHKEMRLTVSNATVRKSLQANNNMKTNKHKHHN